MQPIKLNPNRVVAYVAQFYNVRPQHVLGKSRDRRANKARDTVYAILLRHQFSLSEIGRVMRRHHTTVISARSRVAKKLATDVEWRSDIILILDIMRYSPANRAYYEMH